MRIAVVGAVMHDQIETTDGRRFESFGGILYNALALAVVTRKTDVIVPLTHVGGDHIDLLRMEFLDCHPQINSSQIRINPAGTDENVLKYVTLSSRRERMTIRSPRIDFALLAPASLADAVLINFITGEELDLGTLRWLRDHSRGLIYFDIHNLGKVRKDGVPVEGNRFDDWADWFHCVDIVQANEWEAERLLDFHPRTEEDFRAAALRFLSVGGPRVAVITLGEMGCAVAWRSPNGGARYARIPAIPNLKIEDTTGCGDSFSAGFVVEYLRSHSPLKAALFATTLSGLNCMQKGLDGLSKLTGIRERMEDDYIDLLRQIDEGWDGDAAEDLTDR